jgi:prepilin-type processing-associated H-X9-DG protein
MQYSIYYKAYTTSPGTAPDKMTKYYPFPNNGIGPIWMCPSATMDQATITDGKLGIPVNATRAGEGGFFSYAMNIDLKRGADGTTAFQYPTMPKMTSLRNPSAVVFMFDQVFDPVTENVNGSQAFNSVNPADRQNSFASRHNLGGNINFCDGHVAYFKTAYIQNNPSNGGTPSTSEPLLPDVIWNALYRGAEFN